MTAIFMGLFHIRRDRRAFLFQLEAGDGCLDSVVGAASLGIGMGYHRLLTHRGYKIPKWIEYVLTVCATLALEGGPIFWVATHRMHHQRSDKEGDPHSPIDGKWWAHMGWILTGKSMHHDTSTLARYVPDLAKDKFQVWITNPLRADNRSRPHSARGRRHSVRAVGNFRADRGRPARHVAGEFGDAFVGNAALPDPRPFDE